MRGVRRFRTGTLPGIVSGGDVARKTLRGISRRFSGNSAPEVLVVVDAAVVPDKLRTRHLVLDAFAGSANGVCLDPSLLCVRTRNRVV
jgi:hypothetical protein